MSKIYTPKANLRWNKGVLEQLWLVREGESEREEYSHEWHPVPEVDKPDLKEQGEQG